MSRLTPLYRATLSGVRFVSLVLPLLLVACGGGEPRVPDLRQQSLSDAMEDAEEAGFLIEVPATDDYRNSVMRQAPAPGVEVSRGSVIRITAFHPTPATADRPWPCPEDYDDHPPSIPAGTPLGKALERIARSGHPADVSPLPAVPPTTKGFDAYVVRRQSPPPGRFIRCSTRIGITVGVDP
jgi:hypothetical protein